MNALINIDLFLVGIAVAISFILGFSVFLNDRKSATNKAFLFFSLAVANWSVFNYLSYQFSSPVISLWLLRLVMFSATLHSFGIFTLLYVFPKKEIKFSKIYKFFVIPAVIVNLINTLTPFVFNKILEMSPDGGAAKVLNGPGIAFFGLVVVSLIIAGVVMLIRKTRKAIGIEKTQFRFVLLGVTLTFLLHIVFNFILPAFFENSDFIIFGGLFALPFAVLTAYAIFRHGLLNVKIIATEILTFVLAAVSLFEVILSKDIATSIFRIIVFSLILFFGIFLIRSVRKEVSQREEMEKLAKSLEEANTKLSIQTRYLEALRDFSSSIIETLDFKKVIQKIVDGVSERFGYLGALLLLVSREENKIRPVAISQNNLTKLALKFLPLPLESIDASFETNPALSAVALKTGQIQIDEDMSKFFLGAPSGVLAVMGLIQKTIGIKTTIAVPTVAKEKKVGVLVVFSRKKQEEIAKEEFDILKTIAGQIGVVLSNTELFKEVNELNSYKSDLISVVAHQIKNPLVVIKNYSTMIEDKTIHDQPMIDKTIHTIRGASGKLVDLLNNLLDLGHIEDGKMHYEFEKLNLNDFLKEIADDFKFTAQQKKLEFIFEPLPEEIFVSGDKYKLAQVFRNLIDNSIKYTEAGYVKVSVSESPDNLAKVSITDSGIGMNRELIPKLFQRFSRGVEERQILGTGLGLYISRQIIEDHQGKVWAESEGEGKGSQFYIVLPKVPKYQSV